MDHNMDTPPQSASRASTEATDSQEHQAQKAPSRQRSHSSDVEVLSVESVSKPELKVELTAVEPHKMSMTTTISIEYGPELKSILTIHEDVLRRQSKKFEKSFAEAKSLRAQYAQTKILRDQVAHFVFPEVAEREFEERTMEKPALPLVLKVYERFPLLEGRSAIKNTIEMAIDEQLGCKNTKAPIPGGSKKRNHREMSHGMSLKERLSLLSARGMYHVMGHVFTKMHKMHKTLLTKAKTDPMKAHAQGRIIMPDAEDATIRAIIQWLYDGTMNFQDARQIYEIWSLSDQLGTEALSDLCLTELYNAACGSIQRAHAKGIPISTLLLDTAPEMTDNAAQVVLIHVLKDDNPPEQLLRFVIDTLADDIDMNLWDSVKDIIKPEKAKQLIEAMIARKPVQIQNFNPESIKPEDGENLDQSGFEENQPDTMHAE